VLFAALTLVNGRFERYPSALESNLIR